MNTGVKMIRPKMEAAMSKRRLRSILNVDVFLWV